MRIENVFSWRVVSEQYRKLWSELSKRRASAQIEGNSHPWPMAHAARLFAGHAGAPPSGGPWWLSAQGSDPRLLTDTMQNCFLHQLIPIQSLVGLAEKLHAKRQEGENCLGTNDLEQLYGQCDIPAHQWSRITNLLEKLAIVIAVHQ